MDNNSGENFLGGGPPSRNHNSRDGSEFPGNLFSPGLRSGQIGAHQYATALDFEELRLRHQLGLNQDIDFRRRFMEEQHNQLLSELEYRNKIQQLRELQAQQQQQQQEFQLLSQNPHLLELQQQQQFQSGHENSLLAYLRDDLLLQTHQQMLQDQVQQQLQEQLSRDTHHHHEQEELMAMLQACGNLRGILPDEAASLVTSLRHGEIITQRPSGVQTPDQYHLPPVDHSPVRLEESLGITTNQRVDSTPAHQVNSPRKRSLSVLSETNVGDTSQFAPKRAKRSKPGMDISGISLSSSKDGDKELDKKVLKQLASKKIGADKKRGREVKEKVSPVKKGAARTSDVEKHDVVKVGKKNRGSAITQEDMKRSNKNGHRDDGSTLSGHEESVVNHLGTREKKSGTAKISVPNGIDLAGEKKNCEKKKEANALYDDEAIDIVLNFQRCAVPDIEVEQAKKWNKGSQPPKSTPLIRPVLKLKLFDLPTEPESNDTEAGCMGTVNAPEQAKEIMDERTIIVTNESKDAEDIIFIGTKKIVYKPKKSDKGQDDWWPSDACIRRERQKLGGAQDEEDTDEDDEACVNPVNGISFVNAGIESMKSRLKTSVEPGVLEKLPHCKLYDNCGKNANKKLFCCQTTEMFPFEYMVCCSECSTWRHAQCGGHYKRYTAESVDPSNLLFEAICDQCYLEKKIVDDYPVALARIGRQRIEHIRRCNATNAVMRQAAFARHSGQYKWPLGGVSTSHISGHTRSVQSRHEKAEKQWGEMAARLWNGQELKPKERQRVRTRELERLMVHIEDAESAMDRHNMMLFLQNDTAKMHPAGFEVPRRNIFDPEEDLVRDAQQHVVAKSAKSRVDRTGYPQSTSDHATDSSTGVTTEKDGAVVSNDANNIPQTCAREHCDNRPRFDSIFCSDSCGVSTLEVDLLHSLEYASKLHPSLLRL